MRFLEKPLASLPNPDGSYEQKDIFILIINV